MTLTIGLCLIAFAVTLHYIRNFHVMANRSRDERMKLAVDWRTPPSKRKAPKSRISSLLNF